MKTDVKVESSIEKKVMHFFDFNIIFSKRNQIIQFFSLANIVYVIENDL